MTFGHPYILLGLVVLPLVAVLYIRRAGKREVLVPSLALWKAAAAEAVAETGRRLGALDLSLALALLCLAALIVAASDPVIRAGSERAPRLLLIVDRSASMATRTASGRTRWQRGVEDVSKLLGRMDDGSVMLLGLPLAAGPGLSELSPSQARSQLRDFSPTDMPLDIARELSRCAGLAVRGASAVVVMTDNPAPVPDKLGGKPVLVVSHGGPSGNIAIDAFEVTGGDGGKLSVFVGVRNHSGRRVDVPIALYCGDKLGPEGRLGLAAGARGTWTADSPADNPQNVEVRLKVDDDLPSDNQVSAVRLGAGETRVAYVGRGNQFITRALGLLPGVALSQFRLTGEVKSGFDLYVYDSMTPDKLPPGDVVLIDPATVGPFSVRGAIRDKAGVPVSVARKGSPLLRHVDVGALRVRRVLEVKADSAAEPLITAADGKGTVLMRWQDKRTRVTLVGCGLVLSETNWPMLASFPIFWANVVADVAGRRNALGDVPTSFPVGEHIAVRQKADAELSCTGPDGEPVRLTPGRGARSYFLPTRAGVYTVGGGAVDGGATEEQYAVNMMCGIESANTGTPSRPSAELEESMLAPARGAGVSLWRYFASAALALALGYWAATGRRGR